MFKSTNILLLTLERARVTSKHINTITSERRAGILGTKETPPTPTQSCRLQSVNHDLVHHSRPLTCSRVHTLTRH